MASVQQEFVAFHQANPNVYTTLVGLARIGARKGKKKLGMKMLWEVLRWELFLSTTSADPDYKLNNNFTSRYARLIMSAEPDLAGIFEVRELRA